MTTETPNIPGFNIPLALRQLGNNVKLYTKLLDQFQKTYASAASDIAANIKADDYETAERNAHTIKGLAGSLGATGLQEAAQRLEKLCRDRMDPEAITPALNEFGTEMDAAITGIRSHFNAAPSASPQQPVAVNQSQLAAQLAALSAHINDSDARALMLFEEMKEQLRAYDSNAATRLEAAFEIFDFPAAAEIVATLNARLA